MALTDIVVQEVKVRLQRRENSCEKIAFSTSSFSRRPRGRVEGVQGEGG